MDRASLWEQSDDVIERFEQKAYLLLVDNGTVQLVDQPIEDLPNVQRIYALAEELFQLSQHQYVSQDAYGSVVEEPK